MPPKLLVHIPLVPQETLIQKSWSLQHHIKSFRFPDGVTMKTLISTDDLRIDVHAHPGDPTVATAKIQPNAQAKDGSIQQIINKATKEPHKGTHQVLWQFDFGLGPRFPPMEVFADAIRGRRADAFAAESQSKTVAAPPGWKFDKTRQNFYRENLGGRDYFEPPPEAKEGMWVKEFGRQLYITPDGNFEWKPQPE